MANEILTQAGDGFVSMAHRQEALPIFEMLNLHGFELTLPGCHGYGELVQEPSFVPHETHLARVEREVISWCISVGLPRPATDAKAGLAYRDILHIHRTFGRCCSSCTPFRLHIVSF
ncbi:unnamed protein product [Penicillium bialowiezense]